MEATSYRASLACEACRASKTRCQASSQAGVCQRCFTSRKECVSRAAPRRRRVTAHASHPSAPPSATFRINFAIPARPEADDSLDALREQHARMMPSLFPGDDDDDDDDDDDPRADPSPAPATPCVRSILDLDAHPTFNAASAQSLLASFRPTLASLPCTLLRDDASVPQLALSRPFVLLAILAAASWSRAPRGHSLYDEEFRRVLGLKLVAAGERSLELLQGILIYCSWYPFHLRAKSTQATQYLRLASDLVHDLALDQEPALGAGQVTDHQLEGFRAYLAYSHCAAMTDISWWRRRPLGVAPTPWTATCCDLLQLHAQVPGDAVLASLARLSSIARHASDTTHDPRLSEQQATLLLSGLASQLRDTRSRMPPPLASAPTVRLQALFVAIHLDAAAVMRLPRPTQTQLSARRLRSPPAGTLHACIPPLNDFLALVAALDPPSTRALSMVSWCQVILVVILAVRLCFPLVECPAFDHLGARSLVHIDAFLDAMAPAATAPSAPAADVLSAMRLILALVRDRFRSAVQREAKLPTPTLSSSVGCPMLDGSLDHLFSWETTVDAGMPMGLDGADLGRLWDTMTGMGL